MSRRGWSWGLAIALGLGLGACNRTRQDEGTPPAPPNEGERPSQEIGQFTLRETDAEGRLTWVLKAATAEVFEEKDEVQAEKLHIDFYGTGGDLKSVLTADRGVITRRTNDMRALGNVIVRNAEGNELHTEELAYAAGRGKIVTEAFVTLIRGRDVLTGYGLEADPDLAAGTFEIQRDVHATVRDLPSDAPAAPGASLPAPADSGAVHATEGGAAGGVSNAALSGDDAGHP